MIVKAWNNGTLLKNGAGYGLKLDAGDRIFQREWKTIILELEGTPDELEVNIAKPSFWGLHVESLLMQKLVVG